MLARILYDPVLTVATNVVTADEPEPLTDQVFDGIVITWVESIVETSLRLSMVAATALLAEKTIVFEPADTLDEDVKVAVGVLPEEAVYVFVIVFVGPLKVIVKEVPSAAAGISREILFEEQQETMLSG